MDEYCQFCEIVEHLNEDEMKWVEVVLGVDAKNEKRLEWLKKEITGDCPEGVNFDHWPGFYWDFRDDSLILFSSGEVDIENVVAFMMTFLGKFRPDKIFTACIGVTCNRELKPGVAGGWVIVASRDNFMIEDTWTRANEFYFMLDNELKVSESEGPSE